MEVKESNILFALRYGKENTHKTISNHVKSVKNKHRLQTFLKKVLEIINCRLVQRSVEIADAAVDEWFKVFQVCIDNVHLIHPQDQIMRLNPRASRLDCYRTRELWSEGSKEAEFILRRLATPNSYLPQPSNAQWTYFGTVVVPTVHFWFADFAVKQRNLKKNMSYNLVCSLGSEFAKWCGFRENEIEEALVKPITDELINILENFLYQKSSESKLSIAKKLLRVIISLCVSTSDSSQMNLLLDKICSISHEMPSDIDKHEILEFHCEAAFNIMTAGTKESEFESEFFVKWCSGCLLLVEVLKGLDIDQASEAIVKYTGQWDTHFSRRLPGPIPLVYMWVQIQKEHVDADGPILLGESCHNEESRKKILHQELLVYLEEQDQNAIVREMQKKIRESLKTDVTITPSDWLEEARNMRSYGFHPEHCNIYLNQIIAVGSGVEKSVAYCLRALYTEEYIPNSESVFQDIKSAVQLLNDQRPDDCVPPMEILYSILDLLSLKGRIDLHRSIYEQMAKIYIQSKLPLKNLLIKLWESRRLSHSLCPSPISDSFMDLTNLFGEELRQTSYWLESFGTFQSLATMFINNLPYSQSNVAVAEIKQTAYLLNNNGSRTGPYLAGFMYHDLCEILVSHGRIVEALPCALEAFRLRKGILWGETNYLCKSKSEYCQTRGRDLIRQRSIGSELWSFNSNSREWEEICFITPWSILKCYLESALQVGVILEILGNGNEAIKYLDSGITVAKSHGLTMFSMVFYSFLGEIYFKKRNSDMVAKLFWHTKSLLSQCIVEGFCEKCAIIHQTTFVQRFTSLQKSDLDTCKKSFKSLHDSIWKNWSCYFNENEIQRDIASHLPSEAPRNEFIIRSVSREDAGCICRNMRCLHCLSVRVEECGLMTERIKFQWGLTHRRLLLKLLATIGKCLEKEDRINEAIQVLMHRISVLVGPNPFLQASSTTFLFGTTVNKFSAEQSQLMLHMLEIEIEGDIFSVERASLLYDMCLLSMKSMSSSNGNILGDIPITKLLCWMIHAFVRSRDVPLLHKEVSELLATTFSLSTEILEAQPPLSNKNLSRDHWICFFHQASLGSQFDHQYALKNIEKHLNQGSYISSQAESHHRLVPDSVLLLEKSVQSFFELPISCSIICVSVLSSTMKGVFQALTSSFDKSEFTWRIMVSRLDQSKPTHIFLPIEPIHGDLQCDWVWEENPAVIDQIAPGFRKLMDAVRHAELSSASNYDTRLKKLLRNLEERWFGNMKHVFCSTASDSPNKAGGKSSRQTIMILDDEVQSLPWEILPSLFLQEVYRMPSVWSVLDTFKRLVKINVQKTYYMIDVGCDLQNSHAYRRLIRKHKLKGEPGVQPSEEEITKALTAHEFFIYVGHNSGSQYIRNDIISALPRCPAAVLGGCSSAVFKLNGLYVPESTPLAYLLGGSFCVMGTLWLVWDPQISEFECTFLVEALKGGNQSLGQCMGVARRRLKEYPTLIGGALVCYGVPHVLSADELVRDISETRSVSEESCNSTPRRGKKRRLE